MKFKYLSVILLTSAVTLTACNQNESNDNQTKTESNETKDTTDALKFAQSKKGTIFTDENGVQYKMLKKYTNNDSDKNGMTQKDNNGFKFSFSYMLLENTETKEKSLAYFGEIKNDSDKALEFLNYIHFVTDTGEQLKPDAGLNSGPLAKEYNANSKGKGYVIVPLNYQEDKAPKEIGVTIEQPADNATLSYYGDELRFNLADDGKPKNDNVTPIVSTTAENQEKENNSSDGNLSSDIDDSDSTSEELDSNNKTDEYSVEEELYPADEYNEIVDRYNELVADNEKMDYVNRDVNLEEYNEMIDRYNAVIDEQSKDEESESDL
ncbi:hypothetical protein KNE01_001937 [Staphylococcus pseudintermedius]|uniref:hypothetical protein n=1 Tax=Staphylococcus pseudintermedius TaxID=283734 RepID=UPI001A067992|nr:hypothetical protein [Staphylococcus pseudintermedius]EHP0478947.1 hypothetical protein [Staphylococcus pseudintermedius]EIX6342012.1 hypothetical protein [Staphylococcus pseudintermedius]ELJ9071769.1 hypothetical protein [Staphylococcus pseudintermedius]